MCLSCGCMKPALDHGDERTITYKDYQNGERDYKEAAQYNKGSASEAREYTQKTLAAIKAGKIPATRRK